MLWLRVSTRWCQALSAYDAEVTTGAVPAPEPATSWPLAARETPKSFAPARSALANGHRAVPAAHGARARGRTEPELHRGLGACGRRHGGGVVHAVEGRRGVHVVGDGAEHAEGGAEVGARSAPGDVRGGRAHPEVVDMHAGRVGQRGRRAAQAEPAAEPGRADADPRVGGRQDRLAVEEHPQLVPRRSRAIR